MVRRERAGLRWRPGGGVRPAARRRRLQLGQRIAAVLREPDLERRQPRATDQTFKGFEAIAVSRTDDPQAAAAGTKSAWMPPVLICKQSSTTFSDKEQIWADNASSSPFFGTVYVCWASFRGQEKGNAAPAPLQSSRSRSDGGTTWRAAPDHARRPNNGQRNPLDGCTIRTDSRGTAYVFGVGTVSSTGGKQPFELMSRSTNGGANWSQPQPGRRAGNQPGAFDPVQGRPVIDGVAGARSDLAPAPSVDIANGVADRRRRDGPDRHDATSAGRWPRRTSTSPSRPTAARAGRRRGRSSPPVTVASTRHRPSRPTAATSTWSTTRSPRRSGRPRRRRARSSAWSCTPTRRPRRRRRERSASSTAARRATRAVVQRQRADRRVPRRLRLRRRHPDVWGGRVERQPQRGRLPGDRRLAAGLAGRPEPTGARAAAAVPRHVRQLRHLVVHNSSINST